ncbi:MAG: branched-chain amino acid transaminase [archaeon]
MSNIHPTEFIWFNGKMVPWHDAKTHVLSHSLHYGTAVFEGIRANKTKNGPAIFRLDAHIRRLLNSAKIMQMNCPYGYGDFSRACIELVKANKLHACYIRPLIFFGAKKMGLQTVGVPVEATIAAWEWEAYLGEKAMETGARLKISSYTRHHVDVMMTKSKTSGNYANSTLAKMEAVHAGYDEAVMLDPQGFVCECSAENIFIIKDGMVITPPASNVLEGITRDSILKIAQDLRIPTKEQHFTRDQLYTADESFLSGTAAELTPVAEVDHRIIGSGKPGEITKKLQKKLTAATHGLDSRYKKWLTYVK